MSPDVNSSERRQELDRLVTRAARVLLRGRLVDEIRHAAAAALLWTFVGPLLLFFVAQALHRQVSVWMLSSAALLGPVSYVLGRILRTLLRYRPARHTALALFDARLATHDRLVAADEFLHDTAASDGFKQAAVMDAESYIRTALGVTLAPRATTRWYIEPVSVLGVLAAMMITALFFYRTHAPRLGTLRHDAPASLSGAEHADIEKLRQHEVAPRRVADAREREQENEAEQNPSEPQAQSASQRPDGEARAAQGQSASSSPAAAQSKNSASSSAGEPAAEKSSAPPKPQDTPAEAQNKSTVAQQRGERQSQENRLAMDPTSGAGSSASSAGSPSPFELPERLDKNDLAAKQDDPAAEAEEKDRQEKSNAVSTPSVPDRKAPADRNASSRPSGNSVASDANGRGGPSGLKKTRGVPSMILGIPVADRVQGMPNPGSAKVTRERAKSSVEVPAVAQAEQRLARTDPTGEVLHPRPPPWMQDVIRNYFLAAHGQSDPDAVPHALDSNQEN